MREYIKELSNHLISLKDNGFDILSNTNTIRITNDRTFKYSEIKDDLIPFIHIMISDHNIEIKATGHTRFKFYGLIKPKYITEKIPVNRIINDKYDTDLDIGQLDIIISKKIPKDIEKFMDDFVRNGIKK